MTLALEAGFARLSIEKKFSFAVGDVAGGLVLEKSMRFVTMSELMADDSLLGKIGELIDQNLEPLKQGQVRLEDGQAQIHKTLGEHGTALEALKAGQDDLREKVKSIETTMATKVDILDLGAKLDKYQKKNERRFENLEESTGTHNPHKN